MRRLKMIRAAGLGLALLTIPRLGGAAPTSGTLEMGDFRFVYDANGISGLANPNDPFGATLVPAAGPPRGADAAGARRARGARAGQRGGEAGAPGAMGGAASDGSWMIFGLTKNASDGDNSEGSGSNNPCSLC